MTTDPTATRPPQDRRAIDRFLDDPGEQSFEELFHIFTPQLVAYFRVRGCDTFQAEDLAQEVMVTVYSKSVQIRDRHAFRGWLFTVAHNALCRHYENTARSVRTVHLAEVGDQPAKITQPNCPATLPFELLHCIGLLEKRESEVVILKFIEQWEYHEIAVAHAVPVGTVQSRLFSARKKLALLLTSGGKPRRKAA